jgi:methionine-rich copper-binding protein CopC
MRLDTIAFDEGRSSQLSRQTAHSPMKISLISLSIRAAAAAAALTLTFAQFAQAHAHPAKQAPAAGATVTTGQKDVAIDFDDALEPAFSSIAVTDAAGKSVASGKSAVDASNAKHMSVALDPLTPGMYTVAWIAVAADGHRTQGRYAFRVK